MKKLVVFTQTFCGPCRQLKPHLTAAAKLTDLEIEEWVVDDNWPLCQEYAVTFTPSVFIMNDDNTIYYTMQTTNPKTNAGFSAMDIANEIRDALDDV